MKITLPHVHAYARLRVLAPSLALCALLVAGCGDRAPVAARAASSTATWAQFASDLAPDPAVRYGVLPNGLRYALLSNDRPRDGVALRLHFAHGSLDEADDQQGLAHVLEHMAFNGSENVPEGEMVKRLERAGLAFGPDTNAYTSFDETAYQLDVPSTDAQSLDTAFFLLREVADKLTIEAEALERERGVVLSEARGANTFGFRYTQALWSFLYAGSRIPERFAIGDPDVIATAPVERVRALYEAHHRPDAALFVAVGDLPLDALEARVGETFADWTRPDGAPEEADEGVLAPRVDRAGVFVDPDMPPTLTLAVVRPAAPYADTFESRRARTIEAFAAGAFNRRLDRLARASDAAFVSGGLGFSRVFDVAEQASLSLTLNQGGWREALETAEKELRRAALYGFTEAEVAEQIANARAGVEAAAASADTRQSPSLADDLMGAAHRQSVFTHPRLDRDNFDVIAGEIDAAAVTAAFQAWWRDAAPLLFLAANAAPSGGADALVDAFEASRLVPVAEPETAAELSFAYAELGPLGEVVERAPIADLDAERVRFANGVRLTVKSTDFEDGIVRASVRVGSGSLELPASAPGLDRLVDAVFIRGGLGAHDIDELVTLLAGTTLDLSFSVQADAFTFSSATTPADLGLQMQVYAAYLADPGFRAEARDQYLRALDAWLPTLDATPDAVAARDAPRLLRAGDPRFGIADEADLKARTLEEVARALDRALDLGAIEIAIVGDVDVESAIAAVATSFAALPERGDAEPDFTAERRLGFAQPTGAAPLRLEHTGEADRALLLVYWPSFDDADARRARAARLLERVFDLKLIEDVREELGASYSPTASAFQSRVFPGFGYVSARVEVEPAEIERTRQVIARLARDLGEGRISEDELARARRPILEAVEDSQERNDYWLDILSTAWSDPDMLDRHRTARAEYEALEASEVIAIAREYLTPERAIEMVIAPPDPS